MRLSEAIRLGATLHPQSFGWLFEDYPEPPRQTIPWGGRSGIMASCAIGAATLAVGQDDDYNLAETFPILETIVGVPELGPMDSRTLASAIVALNDQMKWSREQIADWVEQVEREQEGAAIQGELALVGVGAR